MSNPTTKILSQKAKENLENMKKMLDSHSRYIKLDVNTPVKIIIDPEKPVEEVDEEFKGQLTGKKVLRFSVIEAISQLEKILDAKDKLAGDIYTALYDGFTVIEVVKLAQKGQYNENLYNVRGVS